MTDDSHAGRIAAQLRAADEDGVLAHARDDGGQRVQQALLRAEDGDDPATGQEMAVACDCGQALRPVLTVGGDARTERIGVCPACRTAGEGSTALVSIDGPVTDQSQARLARRQDRATAQSVASAAAMLDFDVPQGDYTVRRTTPYTVVLDLPDTVDQAARMRLTDRFRETTDAMGDPVWYVQSFPERIRLTDRGVGDRQPAQSTTFCGP